MAITEKIQISLNRKDLTTIKYRKYRQLALFWSNTAEENKLKINLLKTVMLEKSIYKIFNSAKRIGWNIRCSIIGNSINFR